MQGTWVLAEGFNSFLGNVLHSEGWPSEGRIAMLRFVKIENVFDAKAKGAYAQFGARSVVEI